MELLQLRYFCEVARCSSMTKAAEKFMIPQPAMSQTIARLEKELGVKLFDRVNNRIVLNENGRIFLNYAEKSLVELQNGLQALDMWHNCAPPVIKLLILQNRNQVLKAIYDFKNIYPEVAFEIRHSNDEQDRFDCDIRTDFNEEHTGMLSQKLLTERICVAVSENHRLAGKNTVSLEEIAHETFITMAPSSSLEMWLKNILPYSLKKRNKAIICDDPYYVRKYISMGLGISFIPELAWKGLLDANVRVLQVEAEGFYRTTYLHRKKIPVNRSAVRLFEYILEHYGNFHAQ